MISRSAQLSGFNIPHSYAVVLNNVDVADKGTGILRNADCGKLSRGNLRKISKIKCGTFRKLPLSLFCIPQLKNSAFLRIAKLPFARIVQLMCSQSIATSGVLLCLPFVFFLVRFAKEMNRVVFLNSFY